MLSRPPRRAGGAIAGCVGLGLGGGEPEERVLPPGGGGEPGAAPSRRDFSKERASEQMVVRCGPVLAGCSSDGVWCRGSHR